MIRTMLLVLLALAGRGPWELSFPVEGLTDANGAKLEKLIQGHFKTLKCEGGERVALDVAAKGGLLAITVNCPAAIDLADVRKALADSEFSLKPGTWALWGKVAYAWTSDKALEAKALEALAKELGAFGKAEVAPQETKAGAAYHAHLVIGETPAKAAEIEAIFAKHGVAPMMRWENWPHMERLDCGAKRIEKK